MSLVVRGCNPSKTKQTTGVHGGLSEFSVEKAQFRVVFSLRAPRKLEAENAINFKKRTFLRKDQEHNRC